MKYTQETNHWVVKLEKSEEILSSLVDFCQDHCITAGFFSGIGAAQSASISTYDLESKTYAKQSFTEQLEIVNLNGNVAQFNSRTVIHCHISLGRADFTTLSGHLDKATIAATCEIFLTKFSGQLERKFDQAIGLNLLQLK